MKLDVMLFESLKKTWHLSPKLKLEVVPYLELPANKGANINLWN